ncbi:MAG: MotA/TolQ/ExbB proton channel family protein [Archangium sp.]
MNAVEAMKHVLLQSGASWVLWFLGALSVVCVLLTVERALFYRSVKGDLRQLAEALDAHLARGAVQPAIEALQRSRSIGGSIAAAGLRLAERGPAAVDKAMTSAVALERWRLERGLAFLGTVGNNAPFVGLFGTVIGVIQAFEELGHNAPGHGAAAASQAASQAVMSSIAEALVATAVGILVAIPAVAAYNYLQRQVVSLLGGAEVLSNLVLAYLVDRDAPVPVRQGLAAATAVEGAASVLPITPPPRGA